MEETLEKVTTEEYFDIEAVSQSSLKEIANGPKAYLRSLEPSGPKDYFTFGSAVDVLMTEPDKFAERFIVSDIVMPSDAIKLIVDKVHSTTMFSSSSDALDLKANPALILQFAEELGYGQSWKPETLIKKVVDGGEAYFTHLLNSTGKEVLTREVYERVEKCVEQLTTDFYTSPYFGTPGRVGPMEHLYQLPIMWKYAINDDLITCKSLLDLVVINHTTKTVQGIDIKTTSKPVAHFASSFLKFRYDFQAAYYSFALKYYMSENDMADYEILPYKFIVVETSGYVAPLVFTCTEDTLVGAMEGFITKSGYAYMGVEQAFEDYMWYKNRDWTDIHSRSYIEAEGNIMLDIKKE